MLSSYEKERLDRIKQNESFLQQLNITNIIPTPVTKEKKVKERKPIEPGEIRRSGRLVGKEKPLYVAPPKPTREKRERRERSRKKRSGYRLRDFIASDDSDEDDEGEYDPYEFREDNIQPVRKSTRTRTKVPIYKDRESDLEASTSSSSDSSSSSPTSKRRKGSLPTRKFGYVVMFTGIENTEKLREAVEDLGGDVETSDVTIVTHLVANRFARTAKLLGALCCSPPPLIVTKKWLEASENAGRFVEASRYTLQDPDAEKQYKFSIKEALENAKNRTTKLFQGIHFYLTPGTFPETNVLTKLIKAGGGIVMPSPPTPYILEKNGDSFYMICPKGKVPQDENLSRIDAKFTRDEEFVLSAILQQKMKGSDVTAQTTEEDDSQKDEDGNDSEILNENSGDELSDDVTLQKCFVYV